MQVTRGAIAYIIKTMQFSCNISIFKKTYLHFSLEISLIVAKKYLHFFPDDMSENRRSDGPDCDVTILLILQNVKLVKILCLKIAI